MDTQYGVYVRIQNMNGVLWSSFRDTQAAVAADLDAAFGEGFSQKIWRWLSDGVSASIGAADAAALDLVKQELGATTVETTPADAGAAAGEVRFDPCEVCGALKDKWNPPGVSRAGRRYPGFYGCPNFRNHPR